MVQIPGSGQQSKRKVDGSKTMSKATIRLKVVTAVESLIEWKSKQRRLWLTYYEVRKEAPHGPKSWTLSLHMKQC